VVTLPLRCSTGRAAAAGPGRDEGESREAAAGLGGLARKRGGALATDGRRDAGDSQLTSDAAMERTED
jgi:hypothetical protein